MKKAIALVFVLVISTACTFSKEKSKIIVAKNLVGKWQGKTDAGELLEIWEKVNDSVFNGQSYYILAKDTLHSEKMQLKQNGENLIYVSTIKGQNKDQAVSYNLVDTIQKKLTFENTKNEYPKKIVYQQISKDDLVIEISGKQGEKSSLTNYTLKRIK